MKGNSRAKAGRSKGAAFRTPSFFKNAPRPGLNRFEKSGNKKLKRTNSSIGAFGFN